MVMLYKDPSGERVFSANEGEGRQVTMLDGTPLDSENDVDGLKKKVKRLETMINEYKVHKSQAMHQTVIVQVFGMAFNIFSHACLALAR